MWKTNSAPTHSGYGYWEQKGQPITSAYNVNKQVAAYPAAFMGKPRESKAAGNTSGYPHGYHYIEQIFTAKEAQAVPNTGKPRTNISEFPVKADGRDFQCSQRVGPNNEPEIYRAVTDDKKTVKGVMYHDKNKMGGFSRAEIRPLKERRTEGRRHSN
ncbi:hypothetical protein V2W45_1328249 [Cenococcum geophilum]